MGDVVVFEGFEDGTTRFVGVGAVGEAAVFCKSEDLGEVAGEFFGGHVEGAEAFDARGVDEPGKGRRGSEGRRERARRSLDCARDDTKGNHLAKSGGVLTEVVGGGDFGGAEVGLGDEAIDEGGLAYPTVATEERDLTFE